MPLPALGDAATLRRGAAYAALSVPERARCDQLLQTGERGRLRAAGFVYSRALRRLLVAHVLALPPALVQFATTAAGQPRLQGSAAALHLSLSHSAGSVACVVCADAPCGIDVEENGRLHGRPGRALALAARFFDPGEYAELRALAPAAQPGAFLRLWTLKEAALKAHGVGLHVPPRHLVVRGAAAGCRGQAADAADGATLVWADLAPSAACGLGPVAAANLCLPAAAWPQEEGPPVVALAVRGSKTFAAVDAANEAAFAAALRRLLC